MGAHKPYVYPPYTNIYLYLGGVSVGEGCRQGIGVPSIQKLALSGRNNSKHQLKLKQLLINVSIIKYVTSFKYCPKYRKASLKNKKNILNNTASRIIKTSLLAYENLKQSISLHDDFCLVIIKSIKKISLIFCLSMFSGIQSKL